MKELFLENGLFLVEDNEDFVMNEIRILEVSDGIFIKVEVYGTRQDTVGGLKLRVIKILNN